ncbi:MAG: signal peptidase II, partial [Anaeroplasmataceae bacterium]|nr:signal peptidase II [Anaeroplasmataceae bacterium]
MWITLLLLGGLLILDQLTKYLAEILIIQPGKTVTLIPHILDTTLTYNKGAAWSFM